MVRDRKLDPQEVARLVSVLGISGGPPVTKETSLTEVLLQFLRFASRECCGECMVGHLGTGTLSSLLESRAGERELLAKLSELLRTSAKCDVGKVAGKVAELMLKLELV
ncbi:NADH-ubiquinone oxidoreductase-F iron-sulfur binding region domain-containing protein [Ammonifex thiophilus]|uniref:NADH-ubiquinone oxidoreductase 51kDa subunit iron-sulphur binding domain-containing protein n=1 Tax=Ammonifex thiophilus TaxID=444093 RepID=A0A3D8P0U1_9THEO|nr:NADH-ubiquinone oxidoreductase-F iron-sulfur binding region domain-containing protein [Ammonifex thiophilus]RDV80512.1 hypothetical protein DXX99_10675 [Ammonifex thiophilus]